MSCEVSADFYSRKVYRCRCLTYLINLNKQCWYLRVFANFKGSFIFWNDANASF